MSRLQSDTNNTKVRNTKAREQCVYLCGACHREVHARYRLELKTDSSELIRTTVKAAVERVGAVVGGVLSRRVTRELRRLEFAGRIKYD